MGNIINIVGDIDSSDIDMDWQDDEQSKEEWVVVERDGEQLQITVELNPTLTEPQQPPTVEYPTPRSPDNPIPHSPERHPSCEFPEYGKSGHTLSVIEEEEPQDLSVSPVSLTPRRQSVDMFNEMSPALSLESRHTPHRSRTGSLDSKCRDKPRTSSLESRISETLCLELPVGGVSGRASEELATGTPSPPHSDTSEQIFHSEFQPGGDMSFNTFQGSLVESILRDTKKAFRDGGLTAAVRHVQIHLERDSDHHVTKSLLHKACTLSTDWYTFNIVIMKIDKTMTDYQNERYDSRTPLHVACSYLPVDVNERTKWQQEQQMAKIDKLLTYNPDCTKQDKDGNTPLHLATLHNNTECVRLILKHSPDCINVGNNLGNTALHIACRDNFVGVVKALCEHRADATLTNRTKKRRCPLHQAISKGHTQVVKLLLDYDPKLMDCPDSKMMLPLHLAVKRDCPIIAQSLLRQEHCPVTAVDSEGRTVLHYASEMGSGELVSLILKRDSSREFINAQDVNDDTPLHLAYRHGNESVIKLLKSKNASKRITNKQGETPKEAAVNAGHTLPSKKGVKKLGELLKRRKDYVPKISASDSLVSTTAQTPPPSLVSAHQARLASH